MDIMQNLHWRRIVGTVFLVSALLVVIGLFRIVDQLLGGG